MIGNITTTQGVGCQRFFTLIFQQELPTTLPNFREIILLIYLKKCVLTIKAEAARVTSEAAGQRAGPTAVVATSATATDPALVNVLQGLQEAIQHFRPTREQPALRWAVLLSINHVGFRQFIGEISRNTYTCNQ